MRADEILEGVLVWIKIWLTAIGMQRVWIGCSAAKEYMSVRTRQRAEAVLFWQLQRLHMTACMAHRRKAIGSAQMTHMQLSSLTPSLLVVKRAQDEHSEVRFNGGYKHWVPQGSRWPQLKPLSIMKPRDSCALPRQIVVRQSTLFSRSLIRSAQCLLQVCRGKPTHINICMDTPWQQASHLLWGPSEGEQIETSGDQMHRTHRTSHLHVLSQHSRQCLLLALQFHNMFTGVHRTLQSCMPCCL